MQGLHRGWFEKRCKKCAIILVHFCRIWGIIILEYVAGQQEGDNEREK